MSQPAADHPEALTEPHSDAAAPTEPPAADQAAAPTEPPAADETAAAEQTPEETPPAEQPVGDAPATEQPPAAEEPTGDAPATDQPPAEEPTGVPAAPADETAAERSDAAETAVEAAPAEATRSEGAKDEAATPAKSKRKGKSKKAGQPELRPQDVVARVGDTNERALAYVASPDPKLSRMSRKVRDTLISDLPPVTAGALLGPAALARHFIASAASGRYRDLFALWDLFRQHPADCKPVLAERPQALDRARNSLTTAVRLGLSGRAERVAVDITAAQGLIWQWLRQALTDALPAVGHRPAIASALLTREPDLEVPLPDPPDERWLGEAAAARIGGPLAPPVERVLAANAQRLPATIATLALAHEHYPDQVPAIIERVDLDGPEIGSILAWARDHGHGSRLRERAQGLVAETASRDRAEALARWQAWRERGVELELPEPLLRHSLEGLDLGRPETAVLVARLVADGADIDPQAELDAVSARNRQLGEKAFEAFVCAGLDVTLPKPLAQNPIVRDGTRCPHCLAWTWVRPGHERRCPQATAEPALDFPSTTSGSHDTAPNGAVAGTGVRPGAETGGGEGDRHLAEQPAAETAEQRADEPAEQRADEPAEQRAGGPPDQPAGQPADRGAAAEVDPAAHVPR